MAWSKYNYAIAFLMVVTGSLNTLSTKWADSTEALGRNGEYNSTIANQSHLFDHPFLQSCGMFLGEISCLLVFRLILLYNLRKGKQMDVGPQRFSPFIFLPPALCDVVGTSVMYMGLNMTTASSFQMLRGALIIFTGILTVVFLRRRLPIYKWIGMVIVLVGLVIVGLSDILFKDDTKKDTSIPAANQQIIGDVLIILAQIISASQMILEEKFIGKHDVPPLQAVGWEGAFGLITISLLMIPFNFINVPPPYGKPPDWVLEDPVDGFVQIGNNWQILMAILGNIISIAFFNFAGITVTKELSATTRTVLDSVRTLVVWMAALAIGWESFTYLQPVGFIFLVVGMFVYNDALFRPFLISKGWLTGDIPKVVPDFTSEETKPLLEKDVYGIQHKD